MADDLDSTINMPLTTLPECFKLPDSISGQKSRPSAIASDIQPETSDQLKTTQKDEKTLKIDIDASKAGAEHIGEALPVSSNDSHIKRSISPPLDRAISRKASTLRYQKPGGSCLRNEIHCSGTDNDNVVLTNSKEHLVDASFLKEPHASQGKASDKSAISLFGKCIGAAEVDLLQVPSCFTNSKLSRKELPKGKQFEKVVPPIFVLRDGDITRFALTKLNQSLKVKIRDPSVGLSDDEWAKVPDKFKYFERGALARIWDYAYDPVVRREILEYRRRLPYASEVERKYMDWPNELLLALVDIQEAENQEGAGDVVGKSHIQTGERQLSISSIIEEAADLWDIDILLAALSEIHNALEDPSYDTTIARELLARSKGVKPDAQLTEAPMDSQEDVQTFRFSYNQDATASENNMLLLEKLEKVFGKGKSEESELRMDDATTGQAMGKDGEVVAEGSAIGKGKGKKKKKKRKKNKKSKLLVDDADTQEGKGEECDMPVEDWTMGKGKCKEIELTLEDATTGKGKAKESDTLAKDPIMDKGKGKATELLIAGPATGKGKGKENDLPTAGTAVSKGKCKDCNHHHHEAIIHQGYTDLLSEAKALFLDPKSIATYKVMSADPRSNFGTCDDEAWVPRDPVQVPLTKKEEAALVSYYKVYDLMENFIRPQKASLAEVDRLCRILRSRGFFVALTPVIEELRWNRAIVQHPSNPMITSILQCTAHLRPTDSPLTIPQFPPLPPGPAPATPAVTTPRKKQSKIERTDITKLNQAQIQVRLPVEDALKSLELREEIILTKLRNGVPMDYVQWFADLMAISQSKRNLEEKARLDSVGGPVADMLAKRQKKMAEQDGAPDWLLP